MSTALNRGLISGSVDASLNEIEARSSTPLLPHRDITIGPFAVLNLASSSNKLHGVFTSDATERAADEPHDGAFSESIQPYNTSVMPGEFIELGDDLLHWPDIFDLNDNLFGITSNLSMASTDHAGLSSAPQWLSSENEIQNNSFTMSLDPIHSVLGTHGERQEDGTSILLPQTAMASSTGTADIREILSDAPFLLKIFQKHVVPQLTVVPLGTKTPWNILNVPNAIITLAEITVMESQDITHARHANLFSILSCSAMYLSVTPSAGYSVSKSKTRWRQVASQTYDEAKSHMCTSFNEETNGPTKSKYKDQLMAVCAVIESAVK